MKTRTLLTPVILLFCLMEIRSALQDTAPNGARRCARRWMQCGRQSLSLGAARLAQKEKGCVLEAAGVEVTAWGCFRLFSFRNDRSDPPVL